MEANILEEQVVLLPLIVWNGTIIDGHNRYRIIQAHPDLEWSVREKDFSDRYAAIAWLCKNQLGRRNLTPEQRKYLIGKQYEAEKRTSGAQPGNSNAKRSGQNVHLVSDKTGERIAKENHTNERYVRRAERFAQGIDAAEEVIPGLRQEIFAGKVKPAASEIEAIARASPEERPQLAQALRITKEDKRKARNVWSKDSTKTPMSVTHSSTETPSEPSSQGRFKTHREELQEISRISNGMLAVESEVSPEIYLGSVEGAVTQMICVCDQLFHQYPCLLSEPENREKVLKIMQKPKKYILDLERSYTQ